MSLSGAWRVGVVDNVRYMDGIQWGDLGDNRLPRDRRVSSLAIGIPFAVHVAFRGAVVYDKGQECLSNWHEASGRPFSGCQISDSLGPTGCDCNSVRSTAR